MAAVSTVVAVAAVAVAAVGTAVSYQQSKKAAKAQQQANAMQRQATEQQAKRDELAARQQRLQQLREQQMQRARLVAAGAAEGEGTTSGTQGALSGMSATQAANQQFVDQINQYNSRISGFLQRAADFGGVAQTHSVRATQGQQLANLGMQAFSMSGASFGGGTSPAATTS